MLACIYIRAPGFRRCQNPNTKPFAKPSVICLSRKATARNQATRYAMMARHRRAQQRMCTKMFLVKVVFVRFVKVFVKGVREGVPILKLTIYYTK